MIRSWKRAVGVASVLLAVGACSAASTDSETLGSAKSAFAPGADGARTVDTHNTVLNSYAAATAITNGATSTITVPDITTLGAGFGTGSLIMVMQMQGATIGVADTATTYGNVTALGGAGTFEFIHVASVSGNVITLEGGCGGLKNVYSVVDHTQIIRVREYSSLTVNTGASIIPLPWDGARGGVVALRVSGATILSGTATIDASGLGFRGGELDNAVSTIGITNFRNANDTDGARKGEGIAGSSVEYAAKFNGAFGRGAPANGGGGGDAHNAGGGGGANGDNAKTWNGQGVMIATPGGAPDPWTLDPGYGGIGGSLTDSSGGGRGGYTFANANNDAKLIGPGVATWGGDARREVGGLGGHPLTNGVNTGGSIRYYMGGGGGAGDSNNAAGTKGANGGGFVFLQSGTITGDVMSSIKANGAAATNTIPGHNDAPGGGGGGGSIVVLSTSLAGPVLSANGGAGGNQLITGAESEGPGGGGGGGYIAVSSGTPTRNAGGGANGTTTSSSLTEFPQNGATTGGSGQPTAVAISAAELATLECYINSAPVNRVPVAATVAEDATLAFTAANTISVSDLDARSTSIKVTLTATHGTVTLTTTAGLTFGVGDGTTDTTMAFTGTVAAINAALATATYKPDANYNGPASLTVLTDDQGNTGPAPVKAKTDSDVIAITVTPVNDAPVANPDPASAIPGVPSVVNVLANDTDVDGNTLTVTTVTAPAKGTATKNPDGTITYLAPVGATGTDTFMYTVSDGTVTATTTVTVTIGGTDTDNDGLPDALETLIGTDPNDADSDDDGVKDGDEIKPTEDTDGDGLINALDPDSDNDGLFDGTEVGKDCSGAGTDITKHHCRPDADLGATKTDPLNKDTDGGGKSDGSEDFNLNGKLDPGEGDPTLGHGVDDAAILDTDGDGLSDKLEAELGSDPKDKDTDDDGVLDGDEANPSDDTDDDGLLNVLDADSDNDGLFDGTEMGKPCSDPATDNAKKKCIADGDGGTTKTSPLLKDTDNGGVTDGSEDVNRNGVVDGTETDPTKGHGADDLLATNKDTDGDGLTDAFELAIGSNPMDKDSDDDGVLDGQEPNPAEDTDGDGKPNVNDPDSDGDGLFDGTELGLGCGDAATDKSKNQCIADADPTSRTSPLDPDTDHGGVKDGVEDANHNGKIDSGETDPTLGHGADDKNDPDTDGDGLSDKLEAELGSNPNDKDSDDDGVLDGDEQKPGADSDGDGLVNILDADSDNDGLFDGTEMGKPCSNPATDATKKRCIPDADNGATTTDPLNRDTDNGGVSDGSEDANHNGKVDGTETDPTTGHGADDTNPVNKDTDGDGLTDAFELAIGSNPNDKDSDDDGVLDGQEPNPAEDTDGDGTPNVIDPDSDGDGLFDGTELGLGCDDPATDKTKNQCIADADPSTKTSPLVADTDSGGVVDGTEDTNHNGKLDPGETDPTLGHGADDKKGNGDGGTSGGTSGAIPDGGATSGNPLNPIDEGSLEGGGVSCSSSPSGGGSASVCALGIVVALAFARRRNKRNAA